MKGIMYKFIVGVAGILIWSMCINTDHIYAEQNEKGMVTEEGVLNVEIVRNDGVRVKPGDDEVICTCMQLNYNMDKGVDAGWFKYRLNENEENAETDEQIECRVSCQYAISSDDGMNFDEWKDMTGGAFAFVPGAIADGAYCIRFRKLAEYALKPENTELPEETSVSDNSISENKVDKKKKASYEKSRKAAEKIVASEPIHVIESVKYKVFLDSAAPTIDLSADKDLESWSNENVRCSVMVNDIGSGPSKLIISCGESQITEESYPAGSSLSGYGKDFVISEEAIKDEGCELVIEATDIAGNVNTIRRMVKIDKTAPRISFQGPENSAISDGPVLVAVTGEDAHPSTVCVGYTVKREYDGTEEIAESSAKTLAELKNDILYTAQQDGNYYVECKAVDAAGNTSPIITRSFRVDKTVPGLIFEGVVPGGIYKEDVALKISVFDNFSASYKVKLDGSVTSKTGTSELKLAEYRTDGKCSNNTYYFKADGEYTINAYVTDSAGNSCEDSISFFIDKVAPIIDMNGAINVNEAVVTNEPPTINFRVKESNYETAVILSTLKKTDQNKTTLCKTPEWIMDSDVSDFSLTIEEEGTYELSIKVLDAAGNMSGKTIRFTLDMTKPEIDYIENLNRKYIKSFRLPDNFSEYIHDDSGVDYKTYVNSMNYDEGEEISEDGKYILKVSAVDDAGNQTEKTVEFIVDGTMPRLVIDGMADDGSVNKDDILILSLYDEDDFFTSVKLNGEELITAAKQREVEVRIPDYGDYTINVEASDMADNILTQTIEAKCANAAPVAKGASTVRTLKQNEKSGSNKGLRIFLIVLSVVVFAGAIVVYYLYTVRNAEDPAKMPL